MAQVLSLMATYTGDGPHLPAAEIDDQGSDLEENKEDAGNAHKRCVPAGTPVVHKVRPYPQFPPVHGVRTPSSMI